MGPGFLDWLLESEAQELASGVRKLLLEFDRRPWIHEVASGVRKWLQKLLEPGLGGAKGS